jgi:hypothetical protein
MLVPILGTEDGALSFSLPSSAGGETIELPNFAVAD